MLHFNFSAPVKNDKIRRIRFHRRAKRQLRAFADILSHTKGWPGSNQRKDYVITIREHGPGTSGETVLQSDHLHVRVNKDRGGLVLQVLGEQFALPIQMLKDPHQMAAAVRNQFPYIFQPKEGRR